MVSILVFVTTMLAVATSSAAGVSKKTLTVTKVGSGTVGSNPAGISCGTTCTASFLTGIDVTLTASAATDSVFQSWSGACSGSAPTCTVTMNRSRNVTATFAALPPPNYVLSVATSGSGTITSNPAGIDCGSSCSASFVSGTAVTLSAVTATGNTFSGWGGACSGAANTCTVDMTTARSVTASFAAVPPRDLDLPRIPWAGGPQYWQQFAKANAAGWTDPRFFPISVFLANPEHANSLLAAGINIYMAVEHRLPLSTATSTGMFVMPQQEEWTQEEVGDDPMAVSWFISDECEMGYSNCTPDWSNDNGEYGRLAVQQSYVDRVEAYHDGRFKHANFGNGITRTWWAPNTMDDHVQLMDSASADKYSYTSPDVDDLLTLSPTWPAGANPATAAAYGWQVDQMKSFQDPASPRPVWVFVETAMPYLSEPGARTIQPDQIEGAVWSGLIHGATGVAYFQHNNNGLCGGTSIVECPAVRAKVTAINAQISALAPVLNTQSYQYDFNNGTDTMLKTYNGSAYIFAGIGLLQDPGVKTFALPAGITGTTVTVVGENRTIPVIGGSFSDDFAAEYTHPVYQITQ